MDLGDTRYDLMSKIELVSVCKERAIKGYAQNGITRRKIIQLLKGEIVYKDPREKVNWSEEKKKSFEKALKKRQLKNNLFDYLTKNNPSIITKYVGNQDELKTISYGTMVHYKWKCENKECSNVFEARPREVFRNEYKRSPTKYCSTCKEVNRKEQGIIYHKFMLEKNGSIQTKIPDIINVWCEDNKFKSYELTGKSHEKVKLKCPNKSAKHPDYEISVFNIQESNCFSCPKCSVKTSKAEMRIYSELKYFFKDVKWQQKIEGREADITIEDLKLVIEVDGFPWHMNRTEKDLEKNSVFKKNGYSVLRIRDIQLNEIDCDYIACNLLDVSLDDLNKILIWINNKFKCNINMLYQFNNSDYYKEIQASVMYVPYEESVEYLFPESKKLWYHEKNHPFLPSHFKRGSNMKVWLKCKNGHSYERQIKRLFKIKGQNQILNCPECPKPQIKTSQQRIVEINGQKYNSITECCKKLKISKSYLYQKMKLNNIDNKVIDNIQKEIEKIIANKVL